MLNVIMEDRQHLVREVIDRCTALYIPIQAGIELTHGATFSVVTVISMCGKRTNYPPKNGNGRSIN
jgi:hypothetical protein